MNFKFLLKEEKYKKFALACMEAEKSMQVSYVTTAILSRRALELAVKWLYTNDTDLVLPYQDNLSSLIHEKSFIDLVGNDLFLASKYIVQLGNLSAHTEKPVSRDSVVMALRNLFNFTRWIDYCYSDEYDDTLVFNDDLLYSREKALKRLKEREQIYSEYNKHEEELKKLIAENEKLRSENTNLRTTNTQDRNYKTDNISEADTRQLYIDVELAYGNWTKGNNWLEEVPVEGMPIDVSKTGKGRIDYVFYGDNGKPLALLEAKKTSESIAKGRRQAQLYADCLEKQYGVRPIIFLSNGSTYTIWNDAYETERTVSGMYSKSDLEKLHFKNANKEKLNNIYIDENITNRRYQKEAITAVVNKFDSGQRNALIVMATGSGKTRTAISIVDVLTRYKWVKNVLFLADRVELVKQAKKNFNKLLPNLSTWNLLEDKNFGGRVVFSTYPTMMNAIDNTKNETTERLFTSGYFDLIIIDEAHRSIYNKYEALFEYFDGLLLGLTATPRDEIAKNTYDVFKLEKGLPDYYYELGTAIDEKFLVPYVLLDRSTKFLEKGIKYNELSEDEKEEFESIFESVEDRSNNELNNFLFNKNTVQKVLFDLMENGIKVNSGDTLGKTIIFAKKKEHADFIKKVFDEMYPQYKGEFAKVIYEGIRFVSKEIEDFSNKDKMPQIAISVDMLDTGIDVPEIVNLVFFKSIKSKIKFNQMIGRGTRLCENLFGIGEDKKEFYIFDWCSNFKYFSENKNTKEPNVQFSLTQNIFNTKIEIIKELQHINYQEDDYIDYRNNLINDVSKDILDIDKTRFDVRMQSVVIDKFNSAEKLENLDINKVTELKNVVSKFTILEKEDDLIRRLELIMLKLKIKTLTNENVNSYKNKIVFTVSKILEKGNLKQVVKHKDKLINYQKDEFWININIFEIDEMHIILKELINILDKEVTKIFYTNFADEITKSIVDENCYKENETNKLENYETRLEHYIQEHLNDDIINKIRNNEQLSDNDVKQLENTLFNELGTKEEYQKQYGDKNFLNTISKISGVDRTATENLFNDILGSDALNNKQKEFLSRIIDYMSKNGEFDRSKLDKPPFNTFGSIPVLFKENIEVPRKIIYIIDQFNSRYEELVH